MKKYLRNYYSVAFFGGLVIGILPAIIVNLLSSFFPVLVPEGLALANQILEASSYGFLQYLFIFLVIVFSPIVEELIFRGGLWWLIEKFTNKNVAFIMSTILFCLIHVDPLHVIGLIPISLFFGWLRYKTSSVKASILAHMTNNAVGCILMIL